MQNPPTRDHRPDHRESRQPGNRRNHQTPWHNQNLSPYDSDVHRDHEMHDVGEDTRRMRDTGTYAGGFDHGPGSPRIDRNSHRNADDSPSWWRSEHEDWSPGQRDLRHDFSEDFHPPIRNMDDYGYRGQPQDRYQRDRTWDRGHQNDRGYRADSGYHNDRGYRSDGSGDRFSQDDRRFRSMNSGMGISQNLPRYKEFIGKGPKGFVRSDDRIEEEIAQRLAHGYLDASDIEVIVKNGEVTLQGTVATKDDRRLAEDLIEGCFGMKEVDNRLKVLRGRMSSGADDNHSHSFGKDNKGNSAMRGLGSTPNSNTRRHEA